jgi:beta-glucanase (GH16 family)
MNKTLAKIIFVFPAILFCALSLCAQKTFTKLAFSDEFNAKRNAPIDTAKWAAEIGGEGWGNKELQYYTNSIENAFHDGNGSLVIKVFKKDALDSKCWYGKCQYTSARLITKNKFEQKYGRFEARIKIPRGQGVWSAFWMLGNDIDKVGWAECGEIDIMESIGREPKIVHGTAHGPGYSGASGPTKLFNSIKNRDFADGFHVYGVEWRENEIKWFVDGNLYHTLTPKDVPADSKWVYDHPFFAILNLAIGGDWGGVPDKTTVFPQEMLIDYVRVYKE